MLLIHVINACHIYRTDSCHWLLLPRFNLSFDVNDNNYHYNQLKMTKKPYENVQGAGIRLDCRQKGLFTASV
ncbi:protein of unknown function [Vibrio tapetis subsp. tapetis]|uniref:Uncharacterized protein n=1 Tax=Vibrio tapetis subsp. tapetis TaxID=1671868 RepID=A0A2N8ZLP7_9VIBR|nr:protein of unknown function [Vibrio tapetis subsp. tapetis]